MRTHRVAITGVGAISALGVNASDNWRNAREGRGGIVPHTFDGSKYGPEASTIPFAGVPEGFARVHEERFGRKITSNLDRFALLALCAASEALDCAGLIGAPTLDEDAAIILGHAQGGQDTLETSYARYFGMRSSRLHPATVPRIMLSSAASAVAMQFGIHGPVFAVSSACASSGHAIAQGAALIQNGSVDVAIVGGSEAIATPGCMAGWQAVQALAAETCRPFSAGRDGMVMGEGAAVLVLESFDHASERGARMIGEYLAAGMSSDAHHITQPSLRGVASAIKRACLVGGLLEEKQLLIAAHGTGTVLNDSNEAAAMKQVFGDKVLDHHVIATKSAHGHLIGGSAALQAILALYAINSSVAPPILNFTVADPECDLNLVVGQARKIEAQFALVNAFAFGGLNIALALKGRAP